jgi:hypothetical protein
MQTYSLDDDDDDNLAFRFDSASELSFIASMAAADPFPPLPTTTTKSGKFPIPIFNFFNEFNAWRGKRPRKD